MPTIFNMTMNDGSRHFVALPESESWYDLRDYITKLPGAVVTEFVTDHITEAWIDFTYCEHLFSVNNQYGDYWFFVQDPTCSDEILLEVARYCAEFLGDDSVPSEGAGASQTEASAPPTIPTTELVIRYEKQEDGYSELLVKINENGDLVLDGCDAGEEVRRSFGDWDYEYWLTVPNAFKETLLLHLVKDRFTSVNDMRSWLNERGIPSEFTSF